MIDGIGSDLRYVLRGLRRSPGFTLVAVLSLAIGIGANTAMFGVVKTLLLTPMPVRAPQELALLGWWRDGDFSISQNGSTDYADPGSGVRLRSNYSHPLYRAIRGGAPAGVEVFGFAFLRGASVAMGDQPAVLAGGAFADGAYFSTLDVPMAAGRPLGEADDRPGAPLVAVLSHSLWMRAFGGDPAVVGRAVRVNGNPAEIVGVTGPGFRGLSMGGFFPETEITLPLSSQPAVYPRIAPGVDLFASDDIFWLRLMARVPEGISRAAAEDALEAAMRAQPSPLVAADGFLPELRLIDGAQGAQPVRAETARLLYFLLGVVAMVLLIACANLASLMLAREASRQRETAVRRALGGGRARVIRLTLLEGSVLALAGTGLGVSIAAASRDLLSDLLTGSLGSGAFGATSMRASLDPAVLSVSVGLGVTATLLFGLLPALRRSSVDPIAWLKARGAGAAAPRLTVGRVLIALQIAVSVPLVVGALLFLRTVSNLGAVELGFDPAGIVSFRVDPGYTRLDQAEVPRLYRELLAQLETVPGVRSASLVENLPMSGVASNGTITVDDRRVNLYRNAVGPAFLETMGMRLLSGRMPGLQDDRDAPHVGVLNETAVEAMYGGADPVGRILELGSRRVEIVGVVNDAPYRNQRDPVPATLYDSALQREGYGGTNVVLRVEPGAGASLVPIVRDAVAQVSADLPVPQMRSQVRVIEETSAKERVFSQILTVFAGFALLLASIGLYGVTSYSVERRTGEIGVRVALGARPDQILRMILVRVLVLTLAGLAVGVPAALAVGPVVASLLYGVTPSDGGPVATAATFLLGVALTAGLLPALRAARLEALVALRSE